MGNSLSRILTNVSREDVGIQLVNRGLRYMSSTLLWTIKNTYELRVGEVSATFSAPNRTVVNRNKQRFETEYSLFLDIIDNLRESDVFYDIGANTGLYSIFASKVCSSGTVYSFEPYYPNIKLLRKDIIRNGIDNVRVCQMALSDESAVDNFNQPISDDMSYGESSLSSKRTRSPVYVKTVRGDELILEDGFLQPTVLKIDVEGAERAVIQGLSEILTKDECRLVYCEIHPEAQVGPSTASDNERSEMSVESLLSELNFTVEWIDSGKTNRLLKATK